MALRESVLEGQVITAKDYDLDDFKRFLETLIMDILNYAKAKE